MADSHRLRHKRQDISNMTNLTKNNKVVGLRPIGSYDRGSGVENPVSARLTWESIREQLTPDSESEYYDDDEEHESVTSAEATVGSENELNGGQLAPKPKSNDLEDTMSSAQRNSLLGQSFFAGEDVQERSQIEHERDISMELHRYGAGFSATQSLPTELQTNGGFQSSSSAKLSSSALLIGDQSPAMSSNGGFQSSSSPRLLSDALLPNGNSLVGLGNGGFQSSSSHDVAPTGHASRIYSNGDLWMGQHSNENLATRVSMERPKTRRANARMPRSHRISSLIDEQNLPVVEDREGDDDDWKTISSVKERKKRYRDSTANYSDDSQTSSLRTRRDSDDNILLPPDYIRVAPPKGSINQTNAVSNDEYLRKQMLANAHRNEAARKARQRHPPIMPAPLVAAEGASSRAGGPYQKLSPAQEGRSNRLSQHRRQNSSRHHRSSQRHHRSSRHSVTTDDSARPANHVATSNVPRTPQRVRIADVRKELLRRGPNMVSLLSPSPRVENVCQDEMVIKSPTPAPRRELSMGLYTKDQNITLRFKSRQQGMPGRIHTIPYLARRITHRDIFDEEGERYSNYALIFCAATFVLLPFFGARKLDFVIDKWTSGRIPYFSKRAHRRAWFVFAAEIVVIILFILTGVIIWGVKKS